jgi:hypothetical protein
MTTRRHSQKETNLRSALIVAIKPLDRRPCRPEVGSHETLHYFPVKQPWRQDTWVDMHLGRRVSADKTRRVHLGRSLAEVNAEKRDSYETLYRKSLASHDILFLLNRFCNYIVVKPVRVIVLCID